MLSGAAQQFHHLVGDKYSERRQQLQHMHGVGTQLVHLVCEQKEHVARDADVVPDRDFIPQPPAFVRAELHQTARDQRFQQLEAEEGIAFRLLINEIAQRHRQTREQSSGIRYLEEKQRKA